MCWNNMRFALCLFAFSIGLGQSMTVLVPHHSAKYLGCFSTHSAILPPAHVMDPESSENCFVLCAAWGKPYAGLDSMHGKCYCHRDLQSFSPKREDDSQCKPCPDNPNRTCGGLFKLSIYRVQPEGEESMALLLAKHDGVERVKLEDNSHEILLNSEDDVLAVDYHYSRDEGYALLHSQLYRFPLGISQWTTSVDPPIVVHNYTECQTFTVDWVHDHLIFPMCGPYANIRIADLDGSNEIMLLELPREHPGRLTDIVVDPYARLIFWLTMKSLMACGLDGRQLRAVVKDLPVQEATSLALDMVGQKIYFAGYVNEQSRVYYASYDGSVCQALQTFPDDVKDLRSIGVFQSKVYYLGNVVGNGTYVVRTDRSSRKEVIAARERVTQMKLVHPGLQSPPRLDACTHRGCSYHCEVLESDARCLCPQGLRVAEDGKTCEDEPETHDGFQKFLGSVACIVFLLFASGVLMCICDKIWSSVHPTSVSLNIRNVFTRPERERVRHDSDHLI